jgi:hypothetical protein
MFAATACWAQKSPCLPRLAEPLRLQAAALINAIVSADSESVLKSLWHSGLMIGDSFPTPVSDVRRQFLNHGGLYCLFFDSSCMAAPRNAALWSNDPVLKALPVSFREWLKRAGTPRLETVFLDAPMGKYCNASVMVFSQRTAVPENIEFAFTYLHGRWNLAQIGEIAP